MRLTLLMCTSLSLLACGGNPLVGTWRLTSQVTSASGTMTLAADFELTPASWKAGPGCEVPLTFSGSVAQLTMLDTKCTPTSAAALPFSSSITYDWRDGDEVLIKVARFELVMNLLKIDLSEQVISNPTDPTLGDRIDIHTLDGKGAERVR